MESFCILRTLFKSSLGKGNKKHHPVLKQQSVGKHLMCSQPEGVRGGGGGVVRDWGP